MKKVSTLISAIAVSSLIAACGDTQNGASSEVKSDSPVATDSAAQDHRAKMRTILSKATSAYQARTTEDYSFASAWFDVGNPDEEMAVRMTDEQIPNADFVDGLKKCVFIADTVKGRAISEEDRTKLAEEFAKETLEALATSGWEPSFYESKSDFLTTGDVTSTCSLKIEVGYDLYVLNGYGYAFDH